MLLCDASVELLAFQTVSVINAILRCTLFQEDVTA